jgi:hypothetical protein
MAKNKAMKKKVVKHLKDDIKTFKKEAHEDRELIESIGKHKSCDKKKKSQKVAKVMDEYKEGKLHSGSKKGPVVKSRKQAVAIALSEARRGKKKKK